MVHRSNGILVAKFNFNTNFTLVLDKDLNFNISKLGISKHSSNMITINHMANISTGILMVYYSRIQR